MSQPVEVPLSPDQVALWRALVATAQQAQAHVNLFADTLFRGRGVTEARNIQLVGDRLVGEVADDLPKVAPVSGDDLQGGDP